MASIGVFGGKSEITALVTEDFLKRLGRVEKVVSHVDEVDSPSSFYDIVVITENTQSLENCLGFLNPGGFLALNADSSYRLKAPAKNSFTLVTYGINGKCSVTASSLLSQDGLICCIQREILALNGKTVLEQEFPVKTSVPGADSSSILAAVAALTILGAVPENGTGLG